VVVSKAAILKFFLFSILTLISLWDVYHLVYGKIFDIISFGLICLYLIFSKKLSLDLNDNFVIAFFFISIVAIFIDPMAQMGVLIGIITYIFFRSLKINLSSIVFLVLILLFFLQLVDLMYYFLFDHALSFYSEGFMAKRNYDGSNFFRPTGVFAEANALSVSVIMLYGMISKNFKNYKLITIIVLLSLGISLSLFGFFSAIVIALLFAFENHSFKKSLLLLLTLMILILEIIISLGFLPIILERLTNFQEDPSFIARLGLNIEYSLDVLIPKGFATDPAVMDRHAANGFLSLFYATGIFLPLFIYFYFKSACDLRRKVLYFLILLSNPLFTTALFWAFLARTRKGRCEW